MRRTTDEERIEKTEMTPEEHRDVMKADRIERMKDRKKMLKERMKESTDSNKTKRIQMHIDRLDKHIKVVEDRQKGEK